MNEVDLKSNALNEACWAFINAMPDGAHMNGHAWNNLKPAMKKAIETYMQCRPNPSSTPAVGSTMPEQS